MYDLTLYASQKGMSHWPLSDMLDYIWIMMVGNRDSLGWAG